MLHPGKIGQISGVSNIGAFASLFVHLSAKNRATEGKFAERVLLPAAIELFYRFQATWYVFRDKGEREGGGERRGELFAECATTDRKLVPMRTYRQLT